LLPENKKTNISGTNTDTLTLKTDGATAAAITVEQKTAADILPF
jgi:hypothetical protein